MFPAPAVHRRQMTGFLRSVPSPEQGTSHRTRSKRSGAAAAPSPTASGKRRASCEVTTSDGECSLRRCEGRGMAPSPSGQRSRALRAGAEEHAEGARCGSPGGAGGEQLAALDVCVVGDEEAASLVEAPHGRARGGVRVCDPRGRSQHLEDLLRLRARARAPVRRGRAGGCRRGRERGGGREREGEREREREGEGKARGACSLGCTHWRWDRAGRSRDGHRGRGRGGVEDAACGAAPAA